MSKLSSSFLLKSFAVIGLAYSLHACGTDNNSFSPSVTTPSPTTISTKKIDIEINNNNYNSKHEDNDSSSSSSKPTNNSGSKPIGSGGEVSTSSSPIPPEPTQLLPSKDTTTTQPTDDAVSVKPVTKKPTKNPTKKTDETVAPTKVATKEPTTPPTKTKEPTHNREIKYVSSPGNNTYTNDENTIIVDYSNSSEGYIGIKYSGTNNKVKVIITNGNDKYTYGISSMNYEYFPLQMGNGTYNVSVYENISDNTYMPIFQQDISVSIANVDNTYLYPNQFVWYSQTSNIVKKSQEICMNCSTDFEKVSQIFEYVSSNISYDYDKAATVKSGYVPDVDNILSIKKGICFDYASVFASMCRIQGIPTKLAIGYVNKNNSMIYHAWNYVYTEDKGWITVSFYLENSGYNLVDATFYSTISDKDKAADFINNNSNYQTYQYY